MLHILEILMQHSKVFKLGTFPLIVHDVSILMAAAEGDCEKILLSKNIYLSVDVMITELTDDKICLAHCSDARQLCFSSFIIFIQSCHLCFHSKEICFIC